MRKLDLTTNFVPDDSVKVANYGIVGKFSESDKMDGMDGCSTICMFNSFCKKMQLMGEDCICSHCYAATMAKQYKWMEPDKRTGKEQKYLVVSKEISGRIYDDSEIPVLNIKNAFGVFRIESFGELINTNHAINLIKLIRKNPGVNFGWWSKRPELIARALKALDLSADWLKDRCNCIYSNPWKNSCRDGKLIDVNKVLKKYPFIKGVFTVYTAKYAFENQIFINCGGRKCIKCLQCYDYHENTFFINEILKTDSKKYYKMIGGENI